MTTAEAIALIEAASGPDDLFGRDGTDAYRRLARLTHPDSHPGDSGAASAFTRLAMLWQQHGTGTAAWSPGATSPTFTRPGRRC